MKVVSILLALLVLVGCNEKRDTNKPITPGAFCGKMDDIRTSAAGVKYTCERYGTDAHLRWLGPAQPVGEQ